MQAQSKQSREQQRRKWIAIGSATVVVIGFIALHSGGEKKREPRQAAATKHRAAHKPKLETVSAEEMANVLEVKDPAAIGHVCLAREVVGVRPAFAGFRNGYHRRDPRFPSPAEMFAEVSSRC